MKLEDWVKVSKKKKGTLLEEEVKAGITLNPGDYYFIVSIDPESKWDRKKGYVLKTYAMICPKVFFNKTGLCWNGPIGHVLTIPGLKEEVSGIFATAKGWPNISAKDFHELLLDVGLEWNEKFANRMATNAGANVYFP